MSNPNGEKRDLKGARASDVGAAKQFPSPPGIPDHTLIRRIASGSYGDVWLARNAMGEYRAVKIVYRSFFDDVRPFERELSGIRKFEPISRSHEGFVDVLHVGVNDAGGYFFYIMELGDDCATGRQIDPGSYSPKTLANHVAGHGRLPVKECVELGSALAKATHQLHVLELVHRDIKPSNIIYVEGVAKLGDIGLVTGTDETHSYVGTEGFIPPEGPGSPQADVFSLGRVLYEASTGKDRHFFPALPDDLKNSPDPQSFLELNEVILRACKNDPQARYKTAAEMQADLVVLLNGKSVRRLRQLERRFASAKRAGATLIISATVGVLVAYPLYRQHQTKIEARQRQIGSAIANGNHFLESGDLLDSLPFFADALRLDHEGHGDEAVDRLRLGLILAQCPKLIHLWSARGQITDGEFSPDGKQFVVSFAQGYAQVYDLGSGLGSRVFAETGMSQTASFSPDGSLIATASDDGTASIFDASTLKNVASFIHPDRVKSVRFSPDGLKLITACRDGIARIRDIKSGAVEFSLPHGGRLRFADFSHGGRFMATGGEDCAGRIWDAKTGQLLATLRHPQWVTSIAFSPDDLEVVTASSDHKARVWDIDGHQRFPVLAHEDVVFSAEFSPDGRWLLTGCLDGTARLWRRDTLQPLDINPVLPNGERVSHAAFGPDGRCMAITGVSGAIRVWDFGCTSPPPLSDWCDATADGKQTATLSNGRLVVKDATTEKELCVISNVDRMLTRINLTSNFRFALISQRSENRDNQALKIYNLSTGSTVGDDLPVADPENQFALSEDGRYIAVLAGKTIKIIDTRSRVSLTPTIVARDVVKSAFFDPSGQDLVTWGGLMVQVWNVTNGQPRFAPLEFSNWVSSVYLSHDETQLVGSCWDDQVTPCYSQVWDFKTGKPVGPKLMQGDGVLCSCFSPDGSRIGTASEDFTAIVWNSLGGGQLTQPMRHHDKVRSIAFSPDDRWVVTASEDHTARIWNAATGDPLSPPFREPSALQGAKFFSSGKCLLTVAMNGANRVWKVEPDNRSAADVLNHLKLLSGSTITRFGNFSADQSESADIVWQQLREKYPSWFASTGADVFRWHEFAAEESETNGDWYSVVYHLKWLLASNPADTTFSVRLASAIKNLQHAR